MRKMNLMGSWHTSDIDSEHLSLTVFSTGCQIKNEYIHNRHIVFVSRAKEIANREYAESCKEQFYLDELLQITWCIYAEHKYGKTTDLTFATYEKIFDYSFDFNAMMIEKGLERLCFNKLSKYQKLPLVYLNIYRRDKGLSKWYLEGYFNFHWLEIRQVGEVLAKIKKWKWKKTVTSTDLKIIHEIFITLKKT